MSTDWLAEHLLGPNLVVLDCTVFLRPAEEGGYVRVSGRADYDAGHISGAGFADLITDLCDATKPIGFALPTPEYFCEAMGALGVGDDSRVVLYDRNNSMWAARVWWMLRWVGFDRAGLLDGGQKAWELDGHALSSEFVERVPATLTPTPRPDLIADRDEVMAAINDGSTCLIDALGEAQYKGERTTYGRPGHIPGASNTPAMSLLDPDDGRYLPLDVLAGRFPGDFQARTIAYCGGGIAASSDAFVLTRLGYTNVAVYTASLQEWAADPANPLVV